MRRKLLISGGLLLCAAALCLTLFNLWEDRRAGDAAQEALEELEAAEQAPVLEPEPEIPAYVLNPDMEMPAVAIDWNEYIGTLEIPALDLSLPVISAWSDARLNVAPCRYSGSAYQDNLIIAGHNYRNHFGYLKNLSAGDEVVFTDVDGNRFAYAVSELEQLPGTAIEEMEAGDWDLTLFTCTIGGKARVTVRCQRAD